MNPDALLASGSTLAQPLIEFGFLMLGLGILARVAAKFGFSPVPLYLLVGLAFGEGGIAPLGVNQSFVRVAAEIGAVLLLLMLGLEYSGDELLGTVKQQWRAGLLDIVLNSLPGVICGLLLGWGVLGAVALGGITYISSSGIVAQVVRDLGWKRKPEVRGVVGLLIVEDIVMAPYLPIVTALAVGAGVLGGLISVGVALLVVAIVLFLAVRKRTMANKLLDANQPLALLLTLFGAAVAVAGVALYFGFSSAVAAFLVGLLFTDEVALAARKGLAPLRDLFAAVFFVFLGLNTDPGDIPGVWWVALGLAAAGIATKMITGRIVAGHAGSHSRGPWRAGALLSARGEFSVVIAGIVAVGPNSPPTLLALTTTYVLITAIAGPVMARLVEPVMNWRERTSRGAGKGAVT